MKSDRKNAIWVGILFIISTAAGALSMVPLGNILGDSNNFISLALYENKLIIGVFLELICAGAFVGISVVMYSVLKKYNETIAQGYVIARALESVPFIIGVISLLSIIPLSQSYAQAGASGSSVFVPVISSLIAAHDFTNLIGSMIIFSITAIVLNYALLKTRLVPKFISIWGLIGAPMMLAAGVLGVCGLSFTSTLSVVLVAPIAINEMALALWLIIKGFNPNSIKV